MFYLRCFSAAVIASLFTSTCVSSSDQNRLLPTFQSATGLSFPQSVIELACLANTFPSQFKKEQNSSNFCSTEVSKNYREIKEISGLLYDPIDESFIFNTYPLLGIKGLHLKLFEGEISSDTGYRQVVVLFRHQEHDSYLTDEMNEMMSLFGAAATADRQQGNKEVFGTSAVSSVLRFVRQQFGLDYVPQAFSMFNKIRLHYKDEEKINFIFSGFSAGGLYATVLALYFHWPAITFAATGVEDVVDLYYSDLFQKKTTSLALPPIYNFVHQLDPTPQLDCQLGNVCVYTADEKDKSRETLSEKELEELHLSTIFGQSEPEIIQWLKDLDRWRCTDAKNYNGIFGSCQRERQRWKDRITSLNKDDL